MVEEDIELTLVSPMTEKTISLLQKELNKLLQPFPKLHIKVKKLPLDVYYAKVFAQYDYDITFVTWGGEFPIPVFYLSGFYSTSKYNYSGINDPHIDTTFNNS